MFRLRHTLPTDCQIVDRQKARQSFFDFVTPCACIDSYRSLGVSNLFHKPLHGDWDNPWTLRCCKYGNDL